MKHRNKLVSTLCLIGMAFSLLSGCQETPAAGSGESVLNGDQKEATEITTQLNYIYGLFEVTYGIYQVRDYDMSNIIFVKGDTGWVVFDPLMSVECAQAAKQLVDEQLDELKQVLDQTVQKNSFYMVKVAGHFETIQVRSEYAQQKPYLDLAVDLSKAIQQVETND